MTDWRAARSLDQLLDQLNRQAPFRSRASDGAVGDPRHAARASDHNPARYGWAGPVPVVLARDFTHDPRGGLDCARLYDALMRGQDRRVRYVIWRGQITSGADGRAPWTARRYDGSNPHDKHLHLSVVADARADLRIPWLLPEATLSTPSPRPRRPMLRRGAAGPEVELLQRWLGIVGPDDTGYGVFGPATESAVRRYQHMRGLIADGVVGPVTWAEMGL